MFHTVSEPKTIYPAISSIPSIRSYGKFTTKTRHGLGLCRVNGALVIGGTGLAAAELGKVSLFSYIYI